MSDEQPLGNLLDQIYQSVMQGKYADLDGLEAQIAAVLSVQGAPRDAVLLGRLQQKAARNSVCLQAAGRGMRSALRRLQEVRRATSGLATYDDKGRRIESVGQNSLRARF